MSRGRSAGPGGAGDGAHGAGRDEPELGIGPNRAQFWLLVLVNVFVGAMVGLERTVVPLLAEAEFGVASATALLSFVATFGLAKAAANYVAGRMADARGRKRVLVAGWLVGVPVPLLLLWAPAWGWVVAANALLGVNQGLAWSATVIMKIDLAGPRQRGLATGLNESAGYLAVAGLAYLTGEIAARAGLRPEPLYVGVALVAVGLALSVLLVRETAGHARAEARERRRGSGKAGGGAEGSAPSGREVFAMASWRDRTLLSCSQAGLVNNLTDGLAWGLLPVYFAAGGLSVGEIGVLAGAYPAVWGVLQAGTGPLGDVWGRKGLVVAGLVVQAGALMTLAVLSGFWPWLAASALLGLGTALAYPTLLAAVGDRAPPSWRSSALGTYRLWRDLGYPVGALVAGGVADLVGLTGSLWTVSLLTLASGLVVARLMEPTGAPAGRASRVHGPAASPPGRATSGASADVEGPPTRVEF